jgi:hypothetical protein
VATLPNDNREIQAALQMLDSRLTELLRAGDTLEFGTRYGRQVEFEYEVGLSSSSREAGVIERSLVQPVTGPKESSLLPLADLMRVDGGVRGVLKVSTARYEAWKAEVLAGAEQRAAAVRSRR